jgi:hypothetical protein
MLKFTKNVRYGNLLTVSNTGKKSPQNAQIWLYRCDCGNEVEKEARVVKAGRTESCGSCSISKSLRGIRNTDKVKMKRAWLREHDRHKARVILAGDTTSLSPEVLESIGRMDCSLCGTKPNHKVAGFRVGINKPVRMRKELPFQDGNVQAACKECFDRIDHDSLDVFLEHHVRIQKHLKGK